MNENKFLISAVTLACRLKNDTVHTRLLIQKGLLSLIIRETSAYFLNNGQVYLKVLYTSLFATAYFGLFRVSEVTSGSHPILVKDVHVAKNKKKLQFILQTSKMHGRDKKNHKL